jgi:hypothetical protein
LQHNVYAAPVEAVAVLAKTDMTVAQLLSLSIGQVVPIDLSAPVDLMVDGVSVMQGRYGVRSGQYAMKVESIADTQLPTSAEHSLEVPAEPVVSSQGDKAEGLSVAAQAVTTAEGSSEPAPRLDVQMLEQAANAMSDFTSQVQHNEGAA